MERSDIEAAHVLGDTDLFAIFFLPQGHVREGDDAFVLLLVIVLWFVCPLVGLRGTTNMWRISFRRLQRGAIAQPVDS